MISNSFLENIERITPKLNKWALNFVGNEHDAKDISQETIANLIEYGDKYEEVGKFDQYAFVAAKNIAITFCKGKSKVINHEMKEVSDNSEQANQIIDGLRIEDVLSTTVLDEDEQKALELYATGYKHEEIGEKLGILKVTSRRKIHYIKKKLQGFDF